MKKTLATLILAVSLTSGCAAFASYDWVESQVMLAMAGNYDPRCLNSPRNQPLREVTVQPDGTMTFKCPGENIDTDVDNFYREQSIWEVQPVSATYAGTVVATGNRIACGEPSTRENDELAKKSLAEGVLPKYVYLHLIPGSAAGLTWPWSWSHKELIHNEKNVLRLSVANLHDKRLNLFREEWINFFLQQKGKMDEQTVNREAQLMKEKYAGLFS